MIEKLIKVSTGKDDHLALWKYLPDTKGNQRNILLTHGTFSNRKVMSGIVEYLVEKNFTCWVFEWRSHGESSQVKEKINFETIGKGDFKLIFDYLFDIAKVEKVDCITHSGGGICLTIALLNYPSYQRKINSISMFACQAFGAANTRANYAKIWFGKYLSKLLGRVPAVKIGREENEKYFTMKQWFDWNLSQTFCGERGVDYLVLMKTIRIPILSIFGGGDKLIAPAEACREFLALFHNPLNELLYCSKDTGYEENYDHGRILHSRNASREIYPSVLEWIDKNKAIA